MKTTLYSKLKRVFIWTCIALFAIGLYLAFGAWQLREADASFHHELNKSLVIQSTTFQDGGNMPIRCTCEGGETRPALSIGSLPEGTRSLAVVMTDPDAPAPWLKLFFFMHWVAIDLPPTVKLLEGPPMAPLPAGQVMANSMGKKGYIGPLPTPWPAFLSPSRLCPLHPQPKHRQRHQLHRDARCHAWQSAGLWRDGGVLREISSQPTYRLHTC